MRKTGKCVKAAIIGTIVIMAGSLFIPGKGAQAASLRGKSNEEKVFYYLISDGGFSNASGCGALANISKESSFNPSAVGDNGTSFGICQWHNDRASRLRAWCGDHDYDWHSLEGQLNYLSYELSTYYPNTLSLMKGVKNSKSGAGKAAYYWCKYYEVPADTETKAKERSNLAKSNYWPKYKDAKIGLNKGQTYIVDDLKYKATGDFTVIFKGVANPELTEVDIPSKIVVNGISAKITQIANNACADNEIITAVSIGKNVEKIGKKAFYGCSNLSEVEIYTTTLKSVGKKAFKEIADGSKFAVKKKCKAKFKTMLKGKIPSDAKITKL